MKSSYLFVRRTAVCMVLIFSLAMTGLGRIAAIAASDKVKAVAEQNCSVIELCKSRGTVYDTNMRFITNSETSVAAVIYPTKEAISKIGDYLTENREEILNTLKKGNAAVGFLSEKVWINGVECFSVRRTKEVPPAVHLVGYLDGNYDGSTGLQKSYNELLSSGSISVRIPITAAGKPILSCSPEIFYDETAQRSGVITTIDINIQKIAENASESINSGAVIITEVDSGKIRAMVSRPAYNPQKIYESLNDDSSPLINRAISNYNVGSVFKPCIAAAALENGILEDRSFNCVGKSEIAGRTFRCNNVKGHGNLTLSAALGRSCNCYFYSLALLSGADAIYNTAASFPFLNSIKLADGIVSQRGNITACETLKNSEAATANFAIGQGDIMLSPLAVSTLYEAIANGGIYHIPSLIEGTVENGEIIKDEQTSTPTRAFSENTANILKSCLSETMTDGTGTKGNPEKTTAAGKTATAETGWKKNGNKVTQGWFCGFFPAENPKYVAVILAEGASSGGSVCAPVFKQIADSVADAGLLR